MRVFEEQYFKSRLYWQKNSKIFIFDEKWWESVSQGSNFYRISGFLEELEVSGLLRKEWCDCKTYYNIVVSENKKRSYSYGDILANNLSRTAALGYKHKLGRDTEQH